MKAHRTPTVAALAVMIGACSSPIGPAEQQGTTEGPRYGVMYGSGNRGEDGEMEEVQSTRPMLAGGPVEARADVAATDTSTAAGTSSAAGSGLFGSGH